MRKKKKIGNEVRFISPPILRDFLLRNLLVEKFSGHKKIGVGKT